MWYTIHRWSFSFRTYICWIPCTDQSKTYRSGPVSNMCRIGYWLYRPSSTVLQGEWYYCLLKDVRVLQLLLHILKRHTCHQVSIPAPLLRPCPSWNPTSITCNVITLMWQTCKTLNFHLLCVGLGASCPSSHPTRRDGHPDKGKSICNLPSHPTTNWNK